MKGYNGWKDHETWAASLWISNDESLYRYVRGLTQNGITEWKEVAHLLTINFGSSCTPDKTPWMKADKDEMNAFLQEL